MAHRKLGTGLMAVVVMTVFTWAAEPDELFEEAQPLQQESAELSESGGDAEAEELGRRARGLLQESDRIERNRRDESRPRIDQLRQKLAELGEIKRALEGNSDVRDLVETVRNSADGVEIELRLRRHDREHPRPHGESAERLEHMRIAVEHLQRAGLHDIAEQVARRAEATEKEMHEHQRHHVDNAIHNITKQLDELRHEVHRLRDEVSELRKNR